MTHSTYVFPVLHHFLGTVPTRTLKYVQYSPSIHSNKVKHYKHFILHGQSYTLKVFFKKEYKLESESSYLVL